MSKKLDELIENEVSVDLEKREFMSKFGKYAVVGVGMATLMAPNASASFNSGCKPRKPRKPRKCKVKKWGNGSQGSPKKWKPITLKRHQRP
ncbi:MAG: hypothetical protein DRG09_07480 [Epsilonproteobacteria bacterium]|nr:MAG: hypothetical protein DRG09_07480 [Campylobacterota bacterium]